MEKRTRSYSDDGRKMAAAVASTTAEDGRMYLGGDEEAKNSASLSEDDRGPFGEDGRPLYMLRDGRKPSLSEDGLPDRELDLRYARSYSPDQTKEVGSLDSVGTAGNFIFSWFYQGYWRKAVIGGDSLK